MPACTFENHGALRECEMCGGSLDPGPPQDPFHPQGLFSLSLFPPNRKKKRIKTIDARVSSSLYPQVNEQQKKICEEELYPQLDQQKDPQRESSPIFYSS